ncbi:MAG: copper-containing nitrite reductase [Nitrososphaerales archaeon]
MARYGLLASIAIVVGVVLILLTQFSFITLYEKTIAELSEVKESLSKLEAKLPSLKEEKIPSEKTSESAPEKYKVIIENNAWDPNSKKGYSPKVLKIKVGDSITFVNEDTVTHTLTDKGKEFDSGYIMPGESWTFTFSKAGEYNYFCVPHPWMEGKIIVEGVLTPEKSIAPKEKASQPQIAKAEVENVIRDPSDVPPPIERREPKLVKVTLVYKEIVAELDNGVTFEFWTFNGTVPGPLIRVMEGDIVEVKVINPKENKMVHNVDFHAVTGPGGGAAVSLVKPGETKTFRFKALATGAYIYHCAAPLPPDHVARGMYGVILVEPIGGLPKVDKEFYVVQGEWYTAGKLGEKGFQSFDREKALAENAEYITFNGHVKALTEKYKMSAKVGDRVRLIFGVGGPNIGSNFHIIGEIFDKVYLGDPETYVANEETVYVAPGAAGVFEFKVDVPGRYVLVDHALYRIIKGALGFLEATGPPNEEIYYPQP